MKELIKINKDATGVETVNARDLHEFIESQQDFSNWITSRISQYGFIKEYDFTIILLKSNGGRPSKEYRITVDMAKHLAMVERNQKGREIRQWFIDREGELRKQEMSVANPPKLPNFNDPVAAARAWADAKEQELKAKLELEEAQPKIELYDNISESENSISVAEFANLLSKRGFNTGQNRVFQWLYDNKYLIKRNRPYQISLENKWIEIRKQTYTVVIEGEERTKTDHKVLITGKGQNYFAKKIMGI